MRVPALSVILVMAWVASCATAEDDLNIDPDAATGAKGGTGGSGTGAKGGTGGTGAKGGTGGFGGSGGSGSSGGSFGGGGLGGSGGFGGFGGTSDATIEAAQGFGPCVTEAEVAAQSSQPFQVGFCFNPFACFGCLDDAVNPGDIVCGPNCICAPLPPICTDAGTDADVEAGDAAADVSTSG